MRRKFGILGKETFWIFQVSRFEVKGQQKTMRFICGRNLVWIAKSIRSYARQLIGHEDPLGRLTKNQIEF
jgi:hypothetical protein